MLVLSRKLNESIQIGDRIRITVVRVEGGQIRLGIEAPREITVMRGELLDDGPPTAATPAPVAPPAPERRPATPAAPIRRRPPLARARG
jgi:carbon storage regulator CsrA